MKLFVTLIGLQRSDVLDGATKAGCGYSYYLNRDTVVIIPDFEALKFDQTVLNSDS